MNRDVNSLLGEFISAASITTESRKQKSSLCYAVLSGDHTKALIGQLIIFNQILGELRLDIREQVRQIDRQWSQKDRGEAGLMCSVVLR